MRQVMQNVEARNLFVELCCFGEVRRLLKDFLMEGRVVVCTDISSKSHLKRHDMPVLLTILHIFAYLGGEKMFILKAYSPATTVLKLIVTFLERGSPSAAQASCSLLFSYGIWPYYEDVVSVNDVISFLLEKIETYVPSGDMHQDIVELASLSSSSLPPQDSSAMESLVCEEDPCAHCVNCDPSSCLIKLGMPASQSHAVINHTFCHVIDVLSLVELLARNMS